MYKHVLVPVAVDHDRDAEKAFKVARLLKNINGKITAITVHEYIPMFTEAYVPADISQEIYEAVERAFNEAVPDDITERHVLRGVPATAILDFAEANGVDCIVMASHRPELADYLIGSTAAKVVRHAKCSVHVLR